jgi:predicted Rossmann fold nucleotide-binding protein DprA/Smf involved in DNA uptake
MMSQKPYAGIGSRRTPSEILELMKEIGSKLEIEGWLLRSGGAPGADQAFEAGISKDEAKQIWLPWQGL